MKLSLSKKSMLSALLAVAIGMTLNVPLTVRGAKPNLAKTIQAAATERGDEKKVKEAFDKLPLYFIESQQGEDGHAGYYIQGKDKSLFFTPQGIAVTLETAPKVENEGKAAHAAKIEADAEAEEGRPERDTEAQRWIVQLDFLGANPQARLSGQQQTPAQISYFTGSKPEWRTGLKTYSSIIYRDLWPGIDLVYSGTATQVKHEFIVRPGGDPRDIKLAWRGASSVKLNRDGQLEISTPVSSFTDDKPYSYQEADDKRAEVKTAYQLEPVEEEGVQVYGFAVGEYDRDQTLVIDPAMIIYCGYIGGGADEIAWDVAVDSSGYAYVTGTTYSDSSTNPTSGKFPTTVGPDLTFNGGLGDAFVAKIKADGTGLVYCGYIGGSDIDNGTAIAVDNYGRAYITGRTFSDLPDTLGFDRTYNGKGDAFVARIHIWGWALEYCSFLGGSEADVGTDIAVDSNYNVYVVGNTYSSNFPRLIGPDLTFNGPNESTTDAFVAKISNTGGALLYSGFIGGGSWDSGNGIAVDGAGNAYITGATFSNEQSFPVKNGPDLTYNGGFGGDAFVAKVNASGNGLTYCGYIGGTDSDGGEGIAVNSQGEAYICGATSSQPSSFPVVVGPSLTLRGLSDAFVARLNGSGTGFIYCGYIGGSGNDGASAIALDSAGRAYITGSTQSNNFQVLNGPDSTYNDPPPSPGYQPGTDAFITCVNSNGASLLYSGYFGGIGNDKAWGIAVINGSPLNTSLYGASAIIVGFTNATPANGFPVKTGPSLTYNSANPSSPIGYGDAFVAKISPPDVFRCPACEASR